MQLNKHDCLAGLTRQALMPTARNSSCSNCSLIEESMINFVFAIVGSALMARASITPSITGICMSRIPRL